MVKVQRSLSSALVPLFLFLLVLRLYFQAEFPVIGDEAYYFYWGHHFAGGYYDLPPMIGWIERFFTFFSDEPFWLRLPNLFAMVAVAFGMREWLSVQVSRSKAMTVALLFVFSPFPFLAVLISHDVALLLFTFFSALLFYRAYQVKNPWKEFLFSGVLWGAAFLSKYFAVFILPFYLIWNFTRGKGKRSYLGMIYFFLGVFPFLLQHLHWNANHCWSNFVFNLITRQHIDNGSVFFTSGMMLIYLMILVTPVFWFDLFKKSKKKWFVSRSSFESFVLGMWLVPISMFSVTALLGRGQGLHWYFPYLPFFFLWLGLRYPLEELQGKLKKMMVLTYGFAMLVAVALFFPNQTLRKILPDRFALEYQMAIHGKDWAERIASELNTADWGETDLVMAESYSHASVLNHELHRFFQKDFFWSHSGIPPVAVWGPGTHFGRVFDWTVNFLDYDGKSLTLIARGELSKSQWGQYFEETRMIEKEINGSRFRLYQGKGFHARKYVEDVLTSSWKNYYPKFVLEKKIPSRCEMRD